MSGEQSFAEYEPEMFLSFKEQKTHKVYFDPRVKTKLFTGGQYGDSMGIPVALDGPKGQVYWLRLKSKRLVVALKKIKAASMIEITQTGTGFETTYSVKVLKA